MEEFNSKQFSIKKDGYRKARGGTSKLIDLRCSQCRKNIMVYQKDGPGALLRTYLDRILWPAFLANLQNDIKTKENMPNLSCPECHNLIGTPMVYVQENRFAFRMIPGSFSKKIIK
jgi:hypothetical protein